MGLPRSMTDAELNAAAAIEVLQPACTRCDGLGVVGNGPCGKCQGRSPATDRAAALEVVERVLERRWLDVNISRGHPDWSEWFVQFSNEPTKSGTTVTARNASLSRAICEAALAAVRSAEQDQHRHPKS